MNEGYESREENIDLTKPHIILEKLDGSMIGPFYMNNTLRFATKKGLSPGTMNFLRIFQIKIAFSKTFLKSLRKCRKFCAGKEINRWY